MELVGILINFMIVQYKKSPGRCLGLDCYVVL